MTADPDLSKRGEPSCSAAGATAHLDRRGVDLSAMRFWPALLYRHLVSARTSGVGNSRDQMWGGFRDRRQR